MLSHEDGLVVLFVLTILICLIAVSCFFDSKEAKNIERLEVEAREEIMYGFLKEGGCL